MITLLIHPIYSNLSDVNKYIFRKSKNTRILDNDYI